MSKQASPRPAFWRNLPRLIYLYALIPLALVVGLYAGYGRFARLDSAQRVSSSESVIDVIASNMLDGYFRADYHPLPYYDISRPATHRVAPADEARVMLSRWKRQLEEAGRRAYFARYALLLEEDSPDFERVMRQGERDDPDNALYPVLLANYYLSRGLRRNSNNSAQFTWDYSVRNRSLLDKGIAEAISARKKSYFSGYTLGSRQLGQHPLWRSYLIEDYLTLETDRLSAYTDVVRLQYFQRNMYLTARTLLSLGKRRQAKDLMDCWNQFAGFLLNYAEEKRMPREVVALFTANLANGAVNFYSVLGAEKEMLQALSMQEPSREIILRYTKNGPADDFITLHGPRWAAFNYTAREMALSSETITTLRMHEHLLIEDMMVTAVMSVLMLFIVFIGLQGYCLGARPLEAHGPPRAFVPTWREAVRFLLLGLALPLATYFIYSRLPLFGGRDFGWGSPQWPRFLLELIITGSIVLFLTASLTRQWVRKRCAREGIEAPVRKDEMRAVWIMRVLAVLAIVFVREAYDYKEIFSFLGALTLFILLWLLMRKTWATKKFGSPARRGSIIALSCAIVVSATALIAANTHKAPGNMDIYAAVFVVFVFIFLTAVKLFKPTPYGRYYGTLARTLAPVYACAILFLGLAVLPAVRSREAYWLRQNPNNPWAAAGMQTAVDGDREIIEAV